MGNPITGLLSIDRAALESKLNALRANPDLTPDIIGRIGRLVETRSARELCRVNVLDLAAREGLDPLATVDVFVHAARIGLFDLGWNTVCVFCGAVELFYDSIDRVPSSHFHCTACDADIDALLDERIEVTFTLSAAVGRATIDPYAGLDSYIDWFTSPWVEHSEAADAYFSSSRVGFVALERDESRELPVDVAEGAAVRLVSYDRHFETVVRANGRQSSSRAAFHVSPAGMTPAVATVAAGRATLAVHNPTWDRVGMMVLAGDSASQRHVVEHHRASLRPYLTGRGLLNTQSFRDAFRVQSDDAHLALRMRHITVMFTDLCESTRLYDRLGDAAAYGIVRRHFHEIITATRTHGGAVVKTIGDAVMATFSSPVDGALAAVDIHRRIRALAARIDPAAGAELDVKVGLHAGPALVVNAQGRLDYFGHTVNLASRIQDLARPGRVCVSDVVYRFPGVSDALDASVETSTEEARLRGVSTAVTVHHALPV